MKAYQLFTFVFLIFCLTSGITAQALDNTLKSVLAAHDSILKGANEIDFDGSGVKKLKITRNKKGKVTSLSIAAENKDRPNIFIDFNSSPQTLKIYSHGSLVRLIESTHSSKGSEHVVHTVTPLEKLTPAERVTYDLAAGSKMIHMKIETDKVRDGNFGDGTVNKVVAMRDISQQAKPIQLDEYVEPPASQNKPTDQLDKYTEPTNTQNSPAIQLDQYVEPTGPQKLRPTQETTNIQLDEYVEPHHYVVAIDSSCRDPKARQKIQEQFENMIATGKGCLAAKDKSLASVWLAFLAISRPRISCGETDPPGGCAQSLDVINPLAVVFGGLTGLGPRIVVSPLGLANPKACAADSLGEILFHETMHSILGFHAHPELDGGHGDPNDPVYGCEKQCFKQATSVTCAACFSVSKTSPTCASKDSTQLDDYDESSDSGKGLHTK